ncbi:ABC transporter permease [Candidatus Shapirobacteria bacterium]|nr:MAG: ABC transporter permease [Candidatus Shapirobacteria bacterium]
MINIKEQLKRSMAIAKKNLSIYYFRGPVIIQGLLIPAFLFISFSFKRNSPAVLLVSSLIGMALFFAVSAITPVIAPWETRMKTFERLLTSPISLWAIILGDIIASVLFGFFIVSAIFLILSLFVPSIHIHPLLYFGSLIASFAFSSLSVLISAPPADKPSDIMVISTLLKFPLLFISGVFVPITDLSGWHLLSLLSPLTYYMDLIRFSLQGSSLMSPFVNILILFIFSLLLFRLAVFWHQKSLKKRF